MTLEEHNKKLREMNSQLIDLLAQNPFNLKGEKATAYYESVARAWQDKVKVLLAGAVPYAECGCSIVDLKDGTQYSINCPKHEATDELLGIVTQLHLWFTEGGRGPAPSSLYDSEAEGDKTWAQHIAEVLKKAGVA